MTCNSLSWRVNRIKKLLLWLTIILLLLLAFALRLHRLDSVPLRGDEAFTTVHLTQSPFSDEGWYMLKNEPNPGLLMTYWSWATVAGTSEFAGRYLQVLFGVLGVAVGLSLTHTIQRQWQVALAVGLLWAVNPSFIWYAQDIRQYSMLVALTPLNFYLLLRAIDGDKRRDWGLYVVLQTLTVYLYYIELFWVVAQGLYVLSLKRPALIKKFIGLWMLICILLIPLFAQLYYMLFVRVYEPTAVYAEFSQLFSHILPSLLFGETTTLPVIMGAAVVVIITAGLWLYAQRRFVLLFWLFVPMSLFYILSTKASFFIARYVIAITPVLLIGIGITIYGFASRLNNRSIRHGLSGAALMLLVAVSLVEVNDYFYHDTPKAQDWYGLMAYLDNHTSAQDDILIYGHPSPDIEYYNRDRGNFFMISSDSKTMEADMQALLDNYRDLVVIASEQAGAATAYLHTHGQHIPGDTYPGTTRYRAWEVKNTEIEHPLNLQFGDVARLRGYTILDGITILLYWEALASTEDEYSVLLHLESAPDTPPAHVLDHGMAGSIISARTWTPGTIYRDPVALPADLLKGDYMMRVGLYVYQTDERPPERLPIIGEDNQHDGRFPVGILSVH